LKKSASLLVVALFFIVSAFSRATAAEKTPIKPLPRVSIAPYIERPIAIGNYDEVVDYYLCGAELKLFQILLPLDLTFSACVASGKLFPGNFEPRVDLGTAQDRLIDIAQYAALDSIRLSGDIGFRWAETYVKAGERMVRKSSGKSVNGEPAGSIVGEFFMRHEAFIENWITLSGSGLSPLRYLEARERFVVSALSTSFARMIDSGSNVGFQVYAGVGLRSSDVVDVPVSEKQAVYGSLGGSLRTLIIPLLPMEFCADLRFFPGSPRFLTGGIGLKLVYDFLVLY